MPSYIETPTGRRELGTPQEEENRIFIQEMGLNVHGVRLEGAHKDSHQFRLSPKKFDGGLHGGAVQEALITAIKKDSRFQVTYSNVTNTEILTYLGEGSARSAVEEIAQKSPDVVKAIEVINETQRREGEARNAAWRAEQDVKEVKREADQAVAQTIADGLKG